MRKFLRSVLNVCLAIFASLLTLFGVTLKETEKSLLPVEAENANEKMIEFNVNLEKIGFTDPTHRVFSLFAPFDRNGYGYTTFSISDGAVLSYEFYSSEPLSGVGGVELQVKYTDKKGGTIYTYLSDRLNDSEVEDSNGYEISLFEDLTEELGNGWYKREIKINYSDIADNVKALYLEHFFVSFCPRVEEINDLKESGEKSLKLCYKNIKFTSVNEKTTIVFDGTDNCAIKPSFWYDFKFEPHSIGYGDKNIGLDIFDPMTNYDVTDGEYSVTMNVVQSVNPLTIFENLKNTKFFTQTKYDFNDYISANKSGASVKVQSIVSYEDNQPLTDITAFETTGKYRVKIVADYEGETAIKYVDINVYDVKEPIFLLEELAKFETEFFAGDRYVFPEITAQVGAGGSCPVEITVYAPNGEEFLSDAEGFTPTVKTEGEYVIELKAENEGIERIAIIKVNVIDKDKPVISDENFEFDLRIGEWVTLPTITATDISDGCILADNVTVYNPFGEEVKIKDNSFLVQYSGEYKISVSVTDQDNNCAVKEVYKDVSQGREDMFVLRAYVEPAYRKAGVRKLLHLSLYSAENSNFTFKQGDKICYDVYSSNPIAGIGGVSGQITGNFAGKSWPFWHTLYGDTVDRQGFSADPTTDLRNVLIDENGAPVWYSREIPIGVEMYGADTALFSVIIDTTMACEEYIEVFYRGFRIIREDGSTINLLPSAMDISPKAWETLNVEDALFVATINDGPVILDELLPKSGKLGAENFISSKVVYDYSTHSLLEASMTVTDPLGQNVAIVRKSGGYTFIPEIPGEYKITYLTIDGTALYYYIRIMDDHAPSIAVGEYEKTFKRGGYYQLPDIIITDDETAYDSLDISIKCFFASKEVEIVDGKICMDQLGVYTIIVEVIDAGGNESYQTLKITCEEARGVDVISAGCKSQVSLLSSTIFLLGVCAILLINKTKKFKEGEK